MRLGATIPLATAGLLAGLAPAFAWGIPLGARPILIFVAGLAALSLAFLLFALRLCAEPRRTGARAPAVDTAWLVTIGLVARLILLPGPPILEDDHFRYLWDGAVTAAAADPYAHPPARLVVAPDVARLLAAVGLTPRPPPRGFARLARDGRETLLRINNPHITTIYPPLVQAAFALGHRLSPWSVVGWKLVGLAAEATTLVFLLLALRRLDRPVAWAALYWWNPLVLKEFANTAHMDVLLMPFLAAALWLLVSGRARTMTLAIAGAAAIKFWPLALLPVLWRRQSAAILWSGLAGLIVLALTLPQLLALGDNAGLARYAADWQRNALAFPLLALALGAAGLDAAVWARAAVTTAVIGAIVIMRRRDPAAPVDRLTAAGHVVLLICLLSPTGYPWYALWLAPFAALRAHPAWLLLIAAAPCYYLRFHLEARGLDGAWTWLPPLLCAAPAWIALAAAAAKRRVDA